jgi:SAM-dependent methyltransferase
MALGRLDSDLHPELGRSTAYDTVVRYRVARIEPYVAGRWLDFGCAEGGYDAALLRAGADEVVGADVEPERLEEARNQGLAHATYQLVDPRCVLPFEDGSFDGVFMNEVLEHVVDQQQVLAEVHRVLRSRGVLALNCPNRWFPFEGHGIRVGGSLVRGPNPFVPWLPRRVSAHILRARNYWPHELEEVVRDAGFTLVETGFLWPVFAAPSWLPDRLAHWYRLHIQRFDHMPVVRRLGISTMVIARA